MSSTRNILAQLKKNADYTAMCIEKYTRNDLKEMFATQTKQIEEVTEWLEEGDGVVGASHTATRYNLQTSGKSLKPVGCCRNLVIAQIARGHLTEWEEYCSGQDLRDIYFAAREVEKPLGKAHSPGINNKADLIEAIHAELEKIRASDDVTVE
jgi:hypothetical protein